MLSAAVAGGVVAGGRPARRAARSGSSGSFASAASAPSPSSVDPADRTSSANTSSNDGRASWIEVTLAPWASTAATTAGAVSVGSELRIRRRRAAMRRISSTPGHARSRSTSTSVEVSTSRNCPPNAWRRSVSGGAKATSRPSAMRATVSHSSASGTYCVVITSVRPASRRRCSSCQMAWRTSGSIPAVGSSRKTRSGSCTRAHASCSRRRMPPDSLPARRPDASERSSHSSRARIRRRRANRNRP